MLPSGNSTQLQTQTQTQSKWVEDDTPRKWHLEKSRCSHSCIRQNRFQIEKCNKRQRWTFYKGDNISKRHNVSIYMHPTREYQNM